MNEPLVLGVSLLKLATTTDKSAPIISVVTAIFNGKEHLLDCLESVASQRGVALEHIVIDGGSTDGSVDVLRQWSDRLEYWCSEPDGGIADAMNKGIRRARGEWVVSLHADDYFHAPDALSQALAQIGPSDEIDVAGFPVLFGSPPHLSLLNPRRAGLWLNVKFGMCHQGIFTRRVLFMKFGDYDPTYKIDMDYDFFLRAYRKDACFATFSSPVLSVMRNSGISSRLDWPSQRIRFFEERKIHFSHARNTLERMAYRVYWLVYFPYRRLLAHIRSH